MAINAALDGAMSDAVIRSAYRRVLITEGTISAGFNILLGGLAAWLHFRGHDPATVWGASGVFIDLIPSSFITILLMVLVMSAVIRKRRASGELVLAAQAAPASWVWLIPSGLFWRVMTLGVAATAACLALAASLLALSGAASLPLWILWLAKIVQNGALGLVFGPLIAARALAEPIKPRPLVPGAPA